MIHVAKLGDAYWQVLKVGPVRFDPNPGWILLGVPIGRPRELKWVTPATRFEWVRPFYSVPARERQP